jgi:hypothetical protein
LGREAGPDLRSLCSRVEGSRVKALPGSSRLARSRSGEAGVHVASIWKEVGKESRRQLATEDFSGKVEVDAGGGRKKGARVGT